MKLILVLPVILLILVLAVVIHSVVQNPSKKIKIYLTGSMFSNKLWTEKWAHMLDPQLPYVLTENIHESTIILTINEPHPSDLNYVNANKHKTILCHMETWCDKNVNKSEYLAVWMHDTELNNVEWFFPSNFDSVKRIVDSTIKQNKMSVVVSSKYAFEGHKRRIDFIKYIEQFHPDIEMDVYGRDNPHAFKNYKGPLPSDDKSVALLPYKYHFNCENAFIDNYITEKFTDAILCETFLFYGGAPNVKQIYPYEGYVQLDMTDFEASAQAIRSAMLRNDFETHLHSLRDLKQYILHTYTISHRIHRLLAS